MRKLLHSSPLLGERLDVLTLSAMTNWLIATEPGTVALATEEQLRFWLTEGAVELKLTRYTPHFLWTEWLHVVDAWQITDFEGYCGVPRLVRGRKARLGEAFRQQLWPLCARVRDRMRDAGLRTEAQL